MGLEIEEKQKEELEKLGFSLSPEGFPYTTLFSPFAL